MARYSLRRRIGVAFTSLVLAGVHPAGAQSHDHEHGHVLGPPRQETAVSPPSREHAAIPKRPVPSRHKSPPGSPRASLGYAPVTTPSGSTLALRVVDGVKIGHLVAEEFHHEFAPGLKAKVWGYNGSTPGPTIEVVEGDRLRIYVTNNLPEATSVHWHGLVLPNGMDGVAGLTQQPIAPGATYIYEFTLERAGTFMYHPHYDEMTQIALGMSGMIIVHPRRPNGPRVNRDFVLLTHEWRVPVGAARPDPNEMSDFNVLTFNGKAYPATEPLLVKRGERVRIRLGNLSPTNHHPIHAHGLSFRVTATDGGAIHKSAQLPETTVLVPVGSARVIEFVAAEAGDWPIHCHMTHHVMTQMGHGLPTMLGTDTSSVEPLVRSLVPGSMVMGTQGMSGMGEMHMPVPSNSTPMRGGRGPFGTIDMGGMLTMLKIRNDLSADSGANWYRHPSGTIARPAEPARMIADGIPQVRN